MRKSSSYSRAERKLYSLYSGNEIINMIYVDNQDAAEQIIMYQGYIGLLRIY